MANKKIQFIKIACVVLLVALYGVTRYFHSIYLGAQGYGSGDAYRVILNAYNAGSNSQDIYMISYFYKIAHELLGITYYQISFYATPIIGLLIVLLIFDIIRREVGFIPAMISSLIVVLNPWLAYYSTEPSKEIFVLLFILFALYFLFRFEKTQMFLWLIFSFISFAAGITYYHSILLFFPFYFIAVIYFVYQAYKDRNPFKYIFISGVVFGVTILAIAGPLYVIKETNYKSSLSEKPAYLKTDIDNQGNTFQRQFGAMAYALTKDQQKLGMTKLIEGLDMFLLKQYEFIYLYGLLLIISIFLFKKRKTYMPLLFSILTVYIFVVIGFQWTSYSHTSRYPQYIIYFFLLCASLPLGWSLSLLRHAKVKILILTLFIILSFLVFNPFLKVDGFRNIYYPHMEIGPAAKATTIPIDKNNQIVYLGWPSITLSLLESYNLENDTFLNTFGWELINLDGVTSKRYIAEKNIKYFIYNEGGSDYFDSNKKVYDKLKKNFSLKPISYITEDKKSIIIYQIN